MVNLCHIESLRSNDVGKKIVNCIIAVIVSLSILGTCISRYKLGQCRSELEHYRTELSNAQNREQQLTNTIDECWRSSIRTGEILSSTINSIGDLREQLRQIRENYKIMEDRLLQFYDNNNLDNNCTNYN